MSCFRQRKSILKDRMTHNLDRKVLILIIVSIVNLIYVILLKPLIYLSENQILYIFSTVSQVIGGMFGLTLTGYIFFESKLTEKAREDITLYDQVEVLKGQYFDKILFIGVLCVLSIITCILNISLYNPPIENNLIYDYLLNQAILFSLFEIILIVEFSWSVLNPKRITQLSDKLKIILEKQIKDEIHKNEVKQIEFTEFLKYYNMLEELIITYANELVQSNDRNLKYHKEYKPQIIQSLRILNSHEILNKELFNEINEIRQYRNYTVHGTNFTVDSDIFDRLKNIFEALNDVYIARENVEQRIKAVKRLYAIK